MKDTGKVEITLVLDKIIVTKMTEFVSDEQHLFEDVNEFANTAIRDELLKYMGVKGLLK